jgi:hypothetical protein
VVNVHFKHAAAQVSRETRAHLVCGIATLGCTKKNVKRTQFHGASTTVTSGGVNLQGSKQPVPPQVSSVVKFTKVIDTSGSLPS